MKPIVPTLCALGLWLLSPAVPAETRQPAPPVTGEQQRPLVLGLDARGLFVAPADGGAARTLVRGEFSAGALDAARSLVWVVEAGRLGVIDLQKTPARVIPIVEDCPGERIEVRIPATGRSAEVIGTGNADAGVYPVLEWGPQPRMVEGRGAYAGIWEEEDAAARKRIAAAKVVGRAWLATERQRKRRLPHVARPPRAAASRVVVPEGLGGGCEEETLCGEARRFGGTGRLLVVVEHSCGDACHTGCLLFDPASGRFTDPLRSAAATSGEPEPRSCEGYSFDRSGSIWLQGDRACTVAGGCLPLPGAALGWLDGGGSWPGE